MKGATAYSKVLDQTNVVLDPVDLFEVKNSMIQDIVGFLCNLIRHGLEPVMVFDGGVPRLKKLQSTVHRSEERAKRRARLEKLEQICAKLHPLAITSDVLEEKRKLMRQNLPYFPQWDPEVYAACSSLGISSVRCREESDRLCASLVRDGYCHAVYTTDYDVLIHGVTRMYNKLTVEVNEDGRPEDHFQEIGLEEILNGLNLRYSGLVDLAITMGCDYNIHSKKEHIKKIGPKTALKYIREYRAIPYFPDDKDWGQLNYSGCRSMFYPVPSVSLTAECNFELKHPIYGVSHPEVRGILSNIISDSTKVSHILSLWKRVSGQRSITCEHKYPSYDPFTLGPKTASRQLKIKSSPIQGVLAELVTGDKELSESARIAFADEEGE